MSEQTAAPVELVEQAEAALARIDSLPGTARDIASGAVAALLEVYGAGLARTMDLAGSRAPGLDAALAADELVSHLLLVHGLHPDPVEVRLDRALEEVRRQLRAHDRDLELAQVEDGVAVLRLTGEGHGCTPASVQQAIEDEVARLVPELSGIRLSGPEPGAPVPALIPPETLRRRLHPGEAVP